MSVSERVAGAQDLSPRLLRALQRREPDGVAQIERDFGPMLLGYLAGVPADRQAAEDALQLTMIEVWRRGPTYDPARGSLATWLLTIARSRAIDLLRHRVPEPHDPQAIAEAAESGGEDMADRLLEQWRIAALIRRLPREEADLLRLRFHEGLSQREIAERTGIPLGTVKLRMVRALERLRAMMREDGAEAAR